ncbi:phosphatase PAP2 family protein [Ferruginibacter profundus]
MQATKKTAYLSKDHVIITSVITTIYLLLSAVLVGFKTEQVILAAIFNVLYYASLPSRKFILGFSIFIVYWIVFDYMKAFPNYNFNVVHIESIYNAEKYLFGIHNGGSTLTPNEFLLLHVNTALDIIAGLFYLCWIPVPLLFAVYLFYKNRELFLQFALTFFLVNILGFVVYYIYPAAPPWYVQQHGFHFIEHTAGNTAGLQRFDDFFQIRLFASLYAKSSNVFAAMPSLHSAYPVIVLYYGIKGKLGKINIVFAIIMLGIWLAAVYTSHHYVVDVLAGIGCAISGIALFNKIISVKKPGQLYLNIMQKIR